LRIHFNILAFVFVSAACNQNHSTINDPKTDTLDVKVISGAMKSDQQDTTQERLSFKNIEEVVQYENFNAWVELGDSSASLALHFNLMYKDTLSVSYSPECWLMYPFKTERNKIIVYWDNFIDSKYDFDLVKAISKVERKYIGKPFMILELVNDTTLIATYPIPDLIRKLNSSSKRRTFFPDKFVVSQEFYL
jgi:hypothetical protein